MKEPRSRRLPRALLLVALLGASMLACSDDSEPAPTSSSLRSPANAIVRNLDRGRAHLEVSGDLQATYDWNFRGASDTADVTVVTWGGEGAQSFNVMAMPGAIIPGPHPTSLDLWMDLLLGSTTKRTFNSERGECTLDLLDANQALTGEVTCSELTSQDGRTTISLTGTFTAKPRKP